MKKYLALCLAVLTVLSPMQVFAEDTYTETTEKGSSTIQLFATVTSSYTVKLPKKVDVKNESTEFTIQVKGDIAGNELINLTFPETCSLVETVGEGESKHDDVTMSISADKSSFAYNEINVDYSDSVLSTVTVAHDKLAAGNWSANLNVTISLDKEVVQE